MMTAESGEAKNKVLTSYFFNNSTKGGGNESQSDVSRDLLELLTIDILKEAIQNGRFKDIIELRNLCMEKGDSWMSASGPCSNVPNLLQDKRFYLVGNLKKVMRVFTDEHIEEMECSEVIESLGGFVFSSETTSMPKDYLNMFETYIICPEFSIKNKNIPAYFKKALKLSEQYGWPVIKSQMIKDLASNTTVFPSDISEYLLKPKNIEIKVKKCENIGVTPLKMWNAARGRKK